MNDIIEKFNDLHIAIEMCNDLGPSLKDELINKLDEFEELLDYFPELRDEYEDDETDEY